VIVVRDTPVVVFGLGVSVGNGFHPGGELLQGLGGVMTLWAILGEILGEIPIIPGQAWVIGSPSCEARRSVILPAETLR
jgi:hypothetical protein